MQIILFDNIDRLGMKGDVVNVANGYYRNFLGPRGLALDASQANLKRLEAKRRKLKTEAEKQKQEASVFGKRLAEATVRFVRKSPDGQKLFGSVHDHEIVQQLVEQGFNLEHRQLALKEPLKTVGAHTVKVRLIGNVEAHVTVVIEAERDAAAEAAQAAAEPKAQAAEQPAIEQPAAEGEAQA